MRKLVLPWVLLLGATPLASHAQEPESEWIVAARAVLEPALAAEYEREMTAVVAYAGNQSVAQIVALAFPMSPAEMADWQQRFATALEQAGAEVVTVDDDEVEAENVPASPRPALSITCSAGEYEGQAGISCVSMFLSM